MINRFKNSAATRLAAAKAFVTVNMARIMLAFALGITGITGFAGAVPTYAQETPVPLEIPVNGMFTSANTWMASLGPVLAIGFGITIALALLTLVGGLIVSALKSAGKKS